jgi:histidyl-tRNA synthetase
MMACYLQLDAEQALLMVKLFDRKDKISVSDFDDQAATILEANADDGLAKVKGLMSARNMGDLPVELKNSESTKEIQELFTLLDAAGIDNAVFDITLMRGLDYYTGTVFEVYDTHPDNNRSLFGGGRYDGLVGLFGAEPISAVGMAPGGTMMENFLSVHELMPVLTSKTDIYVIALGDTARQTTKVASELREHGLNIELDVTARKLDKIIKTAIKKHIPYMLFVGDDEVKTGEYTLKNTETAEEQKLSIADIVDTV